MLLKVAKISFVISSFSSPKIISVDFLTPGQASTCLLAREYLKPDDIITIGSCDCKMDYNEIIWVFKGEYERVQGHYTGILNR